MIKVKDINGSTIKLEVRSFSYQGNFMGESYISFDVNSPVYINFEIGDYIEYRGERFVLNYIPSPIKNGTPAARVGMRSCIWMSSLIPLLTS